MAEAKFTRAASHDQVSWASSLRPVRLGQFAWASSLWTRSIGPVREVTNQVPWERLIWRTSGNPPVKPSRAAKLAISPYFRGKMCHRRISRRSFPAASTPALRCPENYGLRGWISTSSGDLAHVLLKCMPRPFVRWADRTACSAIRRNAAGIWRRRSGTGDLALGN
jgi:hypothetical protein